MDLDPFLALMKRKAGFEVVNHDYRPGYLRLMGRVHPNFMGHWKVVMHALLAAEANTGCKIDISKNYFLRDSKILYGWRIIAQGDGVESLPRIVQGSPSPTSADIMEVPLVGASPHRHENRAFSAETPHPGLRRR